MTNDEKVKIAQMRLNGKGISIIAAELGIPINTVKSYCRRNDLSIRKQENLAINSSDKSSCRKCGNQLKHIAKSKPRKFCSEKCRREWWRENSSQGHNRKAYYRFICSHCHKPFESYGNASRKFCSHDCYVKARYGGKPAGDNRAV